MDITEHQFPSLATRVKCREIPFPQVSDFASKTSWTLMMMRCDLSTYVLRFGSRAGAQNQVGQSRRRSVSFWETNVESHSSPITLFCRTFLNGLEQLLFTSLSRTLESIVATVTHCEMDSPLTSLPLHKARKLQSPMGSAEMSLLANYRPPPPPPVINP